MPDAHDSHSEAQWSVWVSELPEPTRRFLTATSEREADYRDLIVSRRASHGAVLLELISLQEAA
jgi:hypothetical protein